MNPGVRPSYDTGWERTRRTASLFVIENDSPSAIKDPPQAWERRGAFQVFLKSVFLLKTKQDILLSTMKLSCTFINLFRLNHTCIQSYCLDSNIVFASTSAPFKLWFGKVGRFPARLSRQGRMEMFGLLFVKDILLLVFLISLCNTCVPALPRTESALVLGEIVLSLRLPSFFSEEKSSPSTDKPALISSVTLISSDVLCFMSRCSSWVCAAYASFLALVLTTLT